MSQVFCSNILPLKVRQNTVQLGPIPMSAYKGALIAVFNFIFAVSGGIFILMGLWLFASFTRTSLAIPGLSVRIPWVLVVLGVSIIVTVLLASLPAEELLYKFFYSSVLFVYAVLELFTGGYLSQYYDTIRSTFKKNLEDHVQHYSLDDEKLMDSIQCQFQCCGVDGPEDWRNSPSKRIPSSCCKVHYCDTNDPTEINDVGCEFVIMYCLNLRLTLMAIVTILSALLPLFGGFLVLFNAYKRATGYKEIPTTDPAITIKNNSCQSILEKSCDSGQSRRSNKACTGHVGKKDIG